MDGQMRHVKPTFKNQPTNKGWKVRKSPHAILQMHESRAKWQFEVWSTKLFFQHVKMMVNNQIVLFKN